MTYNSEGKRTSLENLAGQVTTTAWDCCHKVSEVQPDGSTTTWDYDDEGRVIASSRLIPLDMTNVTWLTTCYEYDDLGRQTATWKTNLAAQVGLPMTRTRYDQLGRVIARVDQLGSTTTTEYSPDGRTVFVRNPNTSTRITTRSASGDALSITGTAVTPEFHTYNVMNLDVAATPSSSQPQQIPCRVHETRYGSANSPRFTRRYENLLGQTIREERSGFQGAVLATVHNYDSLGRHVSTTADYEPTTEYTYDTLGNRIATARMVGRDDPIAPLEWRKTETTSSFASLDGEIWLTQTNIVSCSDSAIAPLVSSSARQFTGLILALPARSRSTDVRGNVTVNEMLVDASIVTSRQTVPYATNKPLSLSRYGVSLMDVSVSAVTNTYAYDALGRHIAHTDGRGNTTRIEYNTLGQQSAAIDAIGNCTTYAYDQFGNLVAITNAIGNATIYEYDLRGRKTYEGGATYPVCYTYDVFGNKTTMMTYRNESLGPNSADVTTWFYDEASGSMTNKVYADGKGPKYNYTPDGKLSQRTWARGVVTAYSYDSWGSLTNTVYSDGTPTISLAYDVLGRQIEVHDAAGVTLFLYDFLGSLTNEMVIGVASTNTIDRYWDAYGRASGYALNGERHTTISYSPNTGRTDSMLTLCSTNAFHWSYVPGSDLKSQLIYPNGLTTSWQYDGVNRLIQVCNSTSTNVISQYQYVYDAAGLCIASVQSGKAFAHDDVIVYAYNDRLELTNAVSNVDSDYRFSYQYDDIGNRVLTNERGVEIFYVANRLNQYLVVDDFDPKYDYDGNQTLIKTKTGIWSVVYNGENRPVRWTSGDTVITMIYDCMGRRVDKNSQSFLYNGYLQVVDTNQSAYIWEPTELTATTPLAWIGGDKQYFYTNDGKKNVSEVINFSGRVKEHYDYTPFGASLFPDGQTLEINPWRYSSEYADDNICLSYYNYRHYNFACGRWLCRDMSEEQGGVNLYAYPNNPISNFDVLGNSQHGCNNVGYTEFQGMSDDEIRKMYKALSTKGRRTPYENRLLAKLKTEEKARAIRRSRLSLRASSCRRGFATPRGMVANLICSLLIAEAARELTQQIEEPPKPNPIAKSASCEKKDDGYWHCECDVGYTAWGAGDLSCKKFKNRPLIMCMQDLTEIPIDVAIALISNNGKQSNDNEQCPCKKDYDCE